MRNFLQLALFIYLGDISYFSKSEPNEKPKSKEEICSTKEDICTEDFCFQCYDKMTMPNSKYVKLKP